MGNLLMPHTQSDWEAAGFTGAREVFGTEEGKAMMKEWGVPETYAGIGNCILGYPVQEAPAKPRKDGYVIFD